MSSAPLVCQRCKQPLRIHDSLTDISPAAFDLLAGSHASNSKKPTTSARTPPYPSDRREIYEKTIKQDPQTPLVKRVIPTSKNGSPSPQSRAYPSTKSNESFVVLTQSQISKSPRSSQTSSSPKPRTMSTSTGGGGGGGDAEKRKVSAKLFDAISGRSDIDYPMCTECADTMLEMMAGKHGEVKKERDGYLEFIKTLQSEGQITPEEKAAAEKELEEIRKAEATAMEELKAAELELSNLHAEIARLEAESTALNGEEAAFWRSRNAFSLSLEEFQNERDEVNIKYDHDAKLLERLQRTNVYNDGFCITHDGFFGVINGLRLGRLPNKQVEWSEINAAWGQTLLLIATVAEKLNFQFEGYVLHPMGSVSKIEELKTDPSNPSAPTKSTMLELFSSGDLPLGRLFMHRKLDSAMVAFLDCLRQLGDFAEAHDANLKLPYKIVKDKIGDACVRLAFNQDETWTRALKYILTNAKWILAYASNLSGSGGDNNAATRR